MDKKFTKSEYLNEVLQTHRMAHVAALMDKYKGKRNQVKEALDAEYTDKKASSAINSGSYAKFDAINIKFDLCQPFKRNSFDTLQAMLDDVYNFFENKYKKTDSELKEVRKQNVSIGLTFEIEGEIIKMDVVPGRELSEGDYEKTKDLNLYPQAPEKESIKTNIQKHIDLIKGKSPERGIIRLLKVWKCHKNKSIKSFFIELITIKAFENNSEVPSDLWEQLKMTMEFIRDKIESIRLEDPSNSNNVVSDTLTATEKKAISADIKNILLSIEKDEQMLTYYFPVNPKFCTTIKDAIVTTVKKENHRPYGF